MAGQLINRGNNTWLVRVYLGEDGGKRVYHNETVHGAKKDAERKRNELLTAHDAGKLTIKSSSHTVGDLLDDVLRDYKINGQDASWAALVIGNLRPQFGKMPISAIRRKHVDSYIADRLAAGRANATINHELSMIRRAFNLARSKEAISVVPFQVPKLEENNVRQGFFEHAEYVRLRDALPSEIRPILAFGYFTGCRKGEILAMQWSQVDLIRRVVRLEPGTTKNAKARTIPLASELYEIIAMLRTERDQDFPECPYVFTRRGVRVRNFRGAWDAACEAAGLWDTQRSRPTRIFHDLRRTGVRNLVRSGVSEKIAMRISGHESRSVFDRYNIVDERDLIDAAARLDRYMDGREQAERARDSDGPHTIRTQEQNRPM